MKFLLPLLAALVLGCASLPAGDQSVAARIGVQYATLKVIDGDAGRAQSVVDVSAQAISLASGESVDIDVLEAQVREAIPWNEMDLADQQLVELLILQVRAELEARTAEGLVDAERVAAAVEVLQWVHDAAVLATTQ